MSTPTKLVVFYHVAHMGTWEAVDREIMGCLKASGLLGSAELVRNDCEDVSQFEFPTIDLLHEHAKANDSFVLYIHTKGVTKDFPCIDDWRACMLYWMVERWRECVAKLQAGRDVVGYTRCERPLPHFQGNFWWARSSYIRTLGNVRDVRFLKSVANQGERHKAEFWVLSNPRGRFYQAYNHGVRPYSERNPRERYVGKKFP